MRSPRSPMVHDPRRHKPSTFRPTASRPTPFDSPLSGGSDDTKKSAPPGPQRWGEPLKLGPPKNFQNASPLWIFRLGGPNSRIGCLPEGYIPRLISGCIGPIPRPWGAKNDFYLFPSRGLSNYPRPKIFMPRRCHKE